MKSSSNDQLAHFFVLSLDLFCVASAEGYFQLLNPAWERTLGYTIDELLAKPYIDFVHPDDVNATTAEQQNLDGGIPVINFENRYRAKDGSWKWLSWKAVPQEDGSVYAVARDVTAQKEDERATQLLLRKLEQSNQELDQFAFVVSHDLKSPLRSIINLSEWIKEDLGDNLKPETAAQIDMLQSRVARMQQLIGDLLQYARTGRDGKPFESVNVRAMIDEIVDVLALPETFQVIVPHTMSPIMGRPSEVYLLFQNLIGNAIKYRSSDTGFVKISQTKVGDFWRFEIEDDGIGIEPKHHQRIFQMFQRLNVSNEIEGTGVGLSLVKKIVDHMGGNVTVKSGLGKGATFSFTWPLKV
jgi:PAS domain S-box-containing protein